MNINIQFYELIAVTTVIDEFPSSPKITSIAEDILASTDPTCTAEEILSFKEVEIKLDEGIVELKSAKEEYAVAVEGDIDKCSLSIK